jgi:hypothetical protein
MTPVVQIASFLGSNMNAATSERGRAITTSVEMSMAMSVE